MKKGAMELSISTVVIVIIALSMLILGLYMTQKMMCGAIEGISSINEQSKEEILGLFQSGEVLVVKETRNTIYKGVEYGVGFAIRSNEDATSEKFNYTVSVSDIGNCKFSKTEADAFMVIGSKGDSIIPEGGEYVGVVRFNIPKSVENCELRYGIEVKDESGKSYGYKEFDVSIKKKSFSKTFC